jgi:hypothetical protein
MPRARRAVLPALTVGALACALLGVSPALAAPRAARVQPTNAEFYGVACASASSCEAVGSWTYQSTPSDGRPLAEHWNGSKWTLTTTPTP